MRKTKDMPDFNAGQRAIVTHIDGDQDLRSYLLHVGITIGTIIYKNYSPRYAGLVSLTINGKMISLRLSEFTRVEWVEI